MGNLVTAAAVIEVLAMIVWVGGLTSLVLLAAPAIFQTISTREVAGETFRSIRRRLDRLGVICGGVILLGATLRYAGRPTSVLYGSEVTRYLLTAAMLAMTLYNGWSVAPRLAEKRDGDQEHDTTQLRLHSLSLTLTAFTLLLGLVMGILFGLDKA